MKMWESFGKTLVLWAHHLASRVMRLRFTASRKNLNTYGDALYIRNKKMLKILAQPMSRFTVRSIRRLDPDDTEHGTWNLVLEGTGNPEYIPGDMAYLSWKNDPAFVQDLLEKYGTDGEEKVSVSTFSSIYVPGRLQTMKLRDALISRVDLNECSPATMKRAGLRSFVRHNKQQDKLHHQFHKDTAKEGGLIITHPDFEYRQLHLPSVLKTMNGSRPSLTALVRRQERISARPYTISGFRRLDRGSFQFEITVSQVEKTIYANETARISLPARGSQFFSRLLPGDEVEGWLLPEVHKFPSTIGRMTPVVVICTGSGIGGLMSLLGSGVESGPIWLIYGVRSWKKKHLYGPELESFLKAGKLSRIDVANSRPLEGEGPAQRVQDFLWANRIEIAEAIRNGAHFYLSGRFSMGTGVAQILEKILVDQGIATDQQAARKTLVAWHHDLRLQASVSGV